MSTPNSYEKMKDLISKINDDATKKELDGLLGEINREKGTALNDLMEIKRKSKDQESDNLTMKEMIKIFKEKGAEVTSPKDILELAKKLNIKTDDNETMDAYDRIIKEQKEKLEKTELEVKNYRIKETIIPKFELAKKEFKDKDGKPVNFIDDFIDKDALTKDLDISNEVLTNARIHNVLQESYTKQVNFLNKNSLLITGQKVHDTKLTDPGITNQTGINATEARKFFLDNGANVDAAARLFAAHEQKINQ